VTGSPPGTGLWPRAGVHRVLGPAGPVAAELATRGWDVAVVPPATDDDALWDGLVAALDLPGWFGRNLDALDEVLRDRAEPTALVLGAWSVYARARPERWRTLLHLLRDWSSPDPTRTAGPARVVLLTD
jgi:RNAse (barnase) inhibitor barstar